jgi:hypothetical protein
MTGRALFVAATGAVAAVLAAALWLTLSARRAADPAYPATARAPSAQVDVEGGPESEESGARTPLVHADPRQAHARGPAPAPKPAAPAAPLVARIEARVLDEEGWPLEGATLSAPALPSALKAESGSDGRVQLEIEALPGELPPEGALLFRFTRADRARVERKAGVLDGETTFLGDVRLAPGASIEGRVSDPAGGPFAGAIVSTEDPHLEESGGAFDPMRRLGSSRKSESRRAETGPDGSFLLDGLPLGEYGIRAHARDGPRGEPAVVELALAGEVRELDLVLPRLPKPKVAGIVLDPRGAPVAGAYVSARTTPGRRPGEKPDLRGLDRALGSLGAGLHQRVGADGRFEFTVEVPTVELLAKDGEQRWAPATLTATAGERDLELRFAEPVYIEVHVRDGDGRAIPWSWVEIAEGRTAWPALPAGESGIARVRLPQERFRLRAFAAGYRTKEIDGVEPEGLTSPLVVALEPGQYVRGRVSAGGRAISGARVELVRAAPPGEPLRAEGATSDERPFAVLFGPDASGEATTDRAGRFVMTLHSGGDWIVRAKAEGHAPTCIGPFRWGPDDAVDGIELELARAGSLRGRVLTRPDSSPEGLVVGITSGDGWLRTRTVGAEGEFRFDDLAPGPWQVRRCLEHVGAAQRLKSFRRGPPVEWDCIVDSGATTVFDLDLRDEDSCVLSGRFSYAEKAATGWSASLLEGTVTIDSQAAALERCELDTDGKFRLSLSKPGAYLLALHGPDGIVVGDRVELLRGETQWERAIATGRLVLDHVPTWQEMSRSQRRCLLRWDGEGALSLADAVPLSAKEPVAPVTLTVPAGRIRLVLAPFSRSMGFAILSPADDVFLAEIDVQVGAEVHFDLAGKR